MPTYEEELRNLAMEADRRTTALIEKYKDRPTRGRDGPASVEERQIYQDFCRKVQELCKKYGRTTI